MSTHISNSSNVILNKKGFCEEPMLSYKGLSEKMVEKGYSLSSLASLLGFKLKKDKDATLLSLALENLSKEQRDAVNRVITSLIDEVWFKKVSACQNPTDRVHELVEKYLPRVDRRKVKGLPESFYRSWEDQHRGTRVNTEDLPKIAEYFNISLHFLFAFPYSISYYSTAPDIEEIITKFLFLPERTKKEILLMVQEVLKNG